MRCSRIISILILLVSLTACRQAPVDRAESLLTAAVQDHNRPVITLRMIAENNCPLVSPCSFNLSTPVRTSNRPSHNPMQKLPAVVSRHQNIRNHNSSTRLSYSNAPGRSADYYVVTLRHLII